MTAFLITLAISAIPAGCFLLGYCIGRGHERQGWEIWLKARSS